jgi:hypothetical protein
MTAGLRERTLDQGRRFAAEVVAPLNVAGDRHHSRLASCAEMSQ